LKKSTPYIILFLIAAAVGTLLFTGKGGKKKEFDNRVTLKKDDKIPYGAYIAYEHLKYLFRDASIISTKQEPGSWDELSNYDTAQALIIVSPRFYADDFEMKKLIRFADKGNDVFISARYLSSDVESMVQGKSSIITTSMSLDEEGNPVTDSITFLLRQPPFGSNTYSYRGLNYHSWFYQLDSSISSVLGSGDVYKPNFIHLKAGKGNIYLHLAPLAFSNYFLLQGNNIEYYENVLSVISPNVRKIVWDEYYLNKTSYYDDDDFNRSSSSDSREADNPISELMRYPETKWALLLAMLIILVYVFMEMRRKQRYIPVITRPRNDSLEFVKTIGRLYYEKGDHKNLSRKMAAYFREHVRNNYKLPTSSMDEDFIQKLQFKTSCDERDIRPIVDFINRLEGMASVSDKQMAEFHRQLEAFYKKA
jgi:hypothetical protein